MAPSACHGCGNPHAPHILGWRRWCDTCPPPDTPSPMAGIRAGLGYWLTNAWLWAGQRHRRTL